MANTRQPFGTPCSNVKEPSGAPRLEANFCEEFVESGVAAIGTRDVQTNRFEFKSGWCVRPEKFEELRRYQVFPGEVDTKPAR